MNASEFLACSHNTPCSGMFECHWCAAPCNNLQSHDDAPILPFQRVKTTAKRPGNPYACNGCCIYRRKRISIRSLGNWTRDKQCLKDYSWWMTKDEVRVIKLPTEASMLYENLLFPPLQFAMSLLKEEKESLIQLCAANVMQEIKADTPLYFLLDNRLLTYTTYELEEALKHGTEGKMPGVRALVDLLGPYLPMQKEEEKKKGRPRVEESTKVNNTKKVISSKAS